jgi:DNA-binding transcriptional MerR regulator
MSELHTYTLAEIEERTGFDRRTISYYVQQGLLPKVGRRGPKTRYPQLFLDRLSFVKLVREKQDQGAIGSLTLAEIRDILDRMPEEMVGDVAAGRERLDLEGLCGPELASTSTMSARENVLARAQRFEDVVNGSNGSHEWRAARETASQAEAQEPEMDLNRKVRLGLMDPASRVKLEPEPSPSAPRNHSATASAPATAVATAAAPEAKPADQPASGPVPVQTGDTPSDQAQAAAGNEDAFQQATDQMVSERIGWALARLQRALTNPPRRSRGNTESWHRARITPELTISARNLPDEQAYLLDNLSRILKKLLWEAWEE